MEYQNASWPCTYEGKMASKDLKLENLIISH